MSEGASTVLTVLALDADGTRVKVLNALARGLPVASLPWGVEGLMAAPDEHVLVGRDDAQLLDVLLPILDDEVRWRELSEAGRRLVRELYVPEVAFGELELALAPSAEDLSR